MVGDALLAQVVVSQILLGALCSRPVVVVRLRCIVLFVWALCTSGASVVGFLDESIDSCLADFKDRETSVALIGVLSNDRNVKLRYLLAKLSCSIVGHQLEFS